MSMKILHRLVHQKADLMKTPMKNPTKENVLLQNVAKNEHAEVGVVAFSSGFSKFSVSFFGLQ